MPFRITTWNVNGIRNPFSYPPWSAHRSYPHLLATLAADILVLQECKIQRPALTDAIVLVPGYDVFFSLPRHKKGYSGVAIYTRTATCCPLRAEEGITGVLASSCTDGVPYREVADRDKVIGGYPTAEQMPRFLDAESIDSEGRAVVLEFTTFVLIGVYAPAIRDETRVEFRKGFFQCLEARVRNLRAMDKEVVVAGDLNIWRDPRDVWTGGVDAEAGESVRRQFNGLVFGGAQLDLDPVLHDVTRDLHPERLGMFTCWDTKRNTRPANLGSRIDYVLVSAGLRPWIVHADIQADLLGSDHCPVYCDFQDSLKTAGDKRQFWADGVNKDGMVVDGVRQREWTEKDLIPESARLLEEFRGRRNIKDMFMRAPVKRPAAEPQNTVLTEPVKRVKMASAPKKGRPLASARQPSVRGFFQPKTTPSSSTAAPSDFESPVYDPIIAKESWLSLLSPSTSSSSASSSSASSSAPSAPLCNHGEPCIALRTKKPGINHGRSFFMCSRPLGPSGTREHGTEWRCGAFVWASDWRGDRARERMGARRGGGGRRK